MQRIYAVRHGQSQANSHSIVSGAKESPLTLLGKEQARLAGEHLKSLGIDRIICSPLGRAQETAKIIAETIGFPVRNIVIIDGLRERGLGELESKSYANNKRFNGNYPDTETIPGVESIHYLHGRVQHVLREVLQDKAHKNVLIVCHMNVCRMLSAIVAGYEPLDMYNVPRYQNGEVRALL